jgi:GMP synthase-like glutamine amidotransferase
MLDVAHIRVGLLDTIPRGFYLPGEATDPQKFMQMFASAGLAFSYETYHVAEGEMPQSLDECDAWLITGSPCSVYEDLPWIPVLEDFIRLAFAAARPQVGVCFGHQIAAQALGGHVARAETGWVLGRHHLYVNVERDWMRERPGEYTLHYINQDQVIDLPPGVRLLGESPRCPNALYEAEGRLLCIQPHPEQPVSSMQVFSDVLLEKGAISEAEHQDCYASLDSGTADSTLIAGWLGQFIIDNAGQKRE